MAYARWHLQRGIQLTEGLGIGRMLAGDESQGGSLDRRELDRPELPGGSLTWQTTHIRPAI